MCIKLLKDSMHALTAKLVLIFTAIVLTLDHFDFGTLLHWSCVYHVYLGTLIVTLCILYYLSANGKEKNIIMLFNLQL